MSGTGENGMDDEGRMVFEIPMNFAVEGTMLGGRIRSRNLLETVLILILLVQPLWGLPLEGKTKIYLAVLFVLPLCILSAIGIFGESLSAFLMSVLYHYRTRRVWGKPTGQDEMELVYRERKKDAGEQKKSGGKRRPAAGGRTGKKVACRKTQKTGRGRGKKSRGHPAAVYRQKS